MVKKSGLVITMSIVLVLAIINVFLFINTGSFSYSVFTGRLVEKIPELPLGLNISLLAFAIQWIILLVIAILAYTRYIKKRNHEHIKISYSQLSKRRGKFETDFDTFYKLLKERKRMRIGVIAKIFAISEEQALEWSKILENSDLVTVEYPAFYEPEVRIKEYVEKKEGEKEVKDEKEVEKKEDEQKEKHKGRKEKGRERTKETKEAKEANKGKASEAKGSKEHERAFSKKHEKTSKEKEATKEKSKK